MLSSQKSSSSTSLAKSQSKGGRSLPSFSKSVVTTPPWARDEPPSPEEDNFTVPSQDILKSSDAVSRNSSEASPSRWWTFNSPRTRGVLRDLKHDLKGQILRDRSMAWTSSPAVEDLRQVDKELQHPPENLDLRISVPPPSAAPFTVSHNQTPGWDSPWTGRSVVENVYNRNPYSNVEVRGEKSKNVTFLKGRKKIRGYLLTNPYVPLLFRFINISFTAATLAVAIRIRSLEKRNGVMGVVGSSPSLAIIFAPLTLVHVMIAIYLEYFGRPLGLWRTSGKLAHTLLETLFICAWSAALSLSFDNYFTSVVPCTQGGTRWYNELPAPPTIPALGRHEGGVGDEICDLQAALICLVGLGLVMYCINLVISLYRIFEKVKYHPTNINYILHASVKTVSILMSERRDYVVGILLLLGVVLLWTASNFITQGIFQEGYHKPFLVTYLNTSSFAVYLIPYALRRLSNKDNTALVSGSREGYQAIISDERLVTDTVIHVTSDATEPLPPLTTRETIRLAFVFCYIWFIANWTVNASLDYTSVASATIMSSMSGFFTLGIGRIFHIEKLSLVKISAVAISFLGVIIVSLSDSSQSQITPVKRLIMVEEHPYLLFGDLLALSSAICYALYVILLKVRIRSESRINVQLFFGFVGLFNVVTCWPFVILLHYIGVEKLELPSSQKAFAGLLINMVITLLSDFIYVIAMLKTTPLVVTVGLSLTIPVAVAGDFFLNKSVKLLSIFGAILVLVSFAVVGLEDSKTDGTQILDSEGTIEDLPLRLSADDEHIVDTS